MFLEKQVTTEGCSKFYFKQFFDLKQWAKESNLYLGEVCITWNTNNRSSEKQAYRSVSLILQTSHKNFRDTLTVINPLHNMVKMQAHQTLEVVLFNDHTLEHMKYKSCVLDSKSDAFQLVLISEKSNIQVKQNNKFVSIEDSLIINRSSVNLTVNPKLSLDSPFLTKLPIWRSYLYQAKHFYYRLDQSSIEKASVSKNGTYSCSKIIYATENSKTSDFGLGVCVAVKGSKRNLLLRQSTTRRSRVMTAPADTKPSYGLPTTEMVLAKQFFQSNYYLINPRQSGEAIQFTQNNKNNTCVIEIAPPCCFDEELPPSAEWSIEIMPVLRVQGDTIVKRNKISFRELQWTMCQGKKIQKFIITPTEEGRLNNEHSVSFLGEVKLYYKGSETLGRIISCYMFTSEVKSNWHMDNLLPSPARQTNSWTQPQSQSGWSPPKPSYVQVTFKEIIKKQLGNIILFKNIIPQQDNNNTYNIGGM
jgi:hypothetical protein